MLECILKTWSGVFCSIHRFPGATQSWATFLSVQNCNCTPSRSILYSKKNTLEKHRVYKNCIPIVLQTKKSYFSIRCHLTNSIFILKTSGFDQVSTMMYLQTFQTLLRFTFKWIWLDSYLEIEFKIKLQFDCFYYSIYDVCHQFSYNILLFPVTTDYQFKMHYTCSVSRRSVKTVFGSTA